MKSVEKVFSEGAEAFEKRRFIDALQILLPIAEAGNAEAQYKVGEIYSSGGRGVFQDDEKAWEWNKKAADQGYTLARAYLLYENFTAKEDNATHIPPLENLDVGISISEVRADLEKMADDNSLDAVVWLGCLAEMNANEGADFRGSVAYFKKAAVMGDDNCLAICATIALEQNLSEDNLHKPISWLEEAHKRGCPYATYILGDLQILGYGVPRNAIKGYGDYVVAADEGVREAAFGAGNCNANGIGTYQCDEEALEWYLMAAKGGHREAQFLLSRIEQKLPSVELPEEEKLSWLQESARRGYLPALSALGWKLITDEGSEDATMQGVGLVRRAAELNDGDAQFTLGVLYHDGLGVARCEATAARWWKASAENGDPDGQRRYGFALLYGTGVDPDPNLAEHYLHQAFAESDCVAAIGLGYLYHLFKCDNVEALGYLSYGVKRLNEEFSSQACALISQLRKKLSPEEIATAETLASRLEARFVN